MFGFGKKSKSFDVLVLKPQDAGQGHERRFYQILFPSAVASDFIQLLLKLQKSKMNTEEILGDLGSFSILTHIEGLEKITIMDQIHPESEPIPFQDFSNHLLQRFNNILCGEEEGDKDEEHDIEKEGQEDLVYFIGEFTLMKDGSF